MENTSKPAPKTKEELENRRQELTFLVGQRTFTEEYIKAEKLQYCQELLTINNELSKMPASAPTQLKEAPKPIDPIIEDIAPEVLTNG